MFFAENILGLERLSLYWAPSDHSPQPYIIPQGYNIVELITDGVVYFGDGAAKQIYRRGTIFWHIAGDSTIYDTTREEPYKCLVCFFKVRDNIRFVPRVSCWRGSDETLEEFVQQMHTAFFAYGNESETSSVVNSYCASELLMHALGLKNFHALSVVKQNDSRDEILLRNIMLHIEKNLTDDLSVSAIASIMKIPRNRLFRLFKEYMNKSPHEYVREIRLETARRHLESSKKSIKEIASECGFDHIEVFHRSYVQRFGETPGQYRRNHFPYHVQEKR